MITIVLFVIFTLILVMSIPLFELISTVTEYDKLRKMGITSTAEHAPARAAETPPLRAA